MDVISTRDLCTSGVPRRVIAARCRPGGPWQEVLPGVVLLKSTYPSRLDRLRAVLAFAPAAIITGIDALRLLGARLPEPSMIHVLQGANQRLNGQGLLFERTTRPPSTILRSGVRLAEPHRAAIDAARRLPSSIELLHLLGTVLRTGLCTPQGLLDELDAGTTRGTAVVRKALTTLAHQ